MKHDIKGGICILLTLLCITLCVSGPVASPPVQQSPCESECSSSTVRLVLQDARSWADQVSCVVSNLPFGRFLSIDDHTIEEMLSALSQNCVSCSFVTSKRIGHVLKRLGLVVYCEVQTDALGKRFLTCASRPRMSM